MSTSLKYSNDELLFLKNIGFKIQFYRKKTGLSQEQLAEKCGLSYSTISHIEATQSYTLSIMTLYKIAKALNVEPYQILMFE